MKILFLTQWFDPEPMLRDSHYIKALQAEGHEVEVVTGFPNYPGGKIYPGYRIQLFKREIINGVKVLRLPLYPSHDGSGVRRMLTYSSFAFCTGVYGLFKWRKPNMIIAYALPPLGAVAAVVGMLRRIPFIFEIHDLWPDTLQATGFVGRPRLIKWVGKVCHWVYRRAAKIVVSSPGFKTTLIERGVPEAKIETIYNFCNEERLLNPQPIDMKLFGFEGHFNVVYAGAMGPPQHLQTIILAAQKVAIINPDIRFVFIGEGIEKKALQQLSENEQLTTVCFFDAIGSGQIGNILKAADVLLVHLKDDPLFALTIPSKLQANLAVGKPILMTVKGSAAALLNEAKAGVCTQSNDPEAIAESVLYLAGLSHEERLQMGENGRKYYQVHLSFQENVRRYSQVIKEAIA